MPPARKSTPASLDSLLENKTAPEETPVTPEETPVTEEPITGEPASDPVVLPDDAPESDTEENVTLIPSDEDHVHTWEENPEHNLAKLHPDVAPASPPSDNASVTRTVTETVYADESEYDDKGLRGTPKSDDEEFDRDEDYTDENETGF